jgi:hypothetical protein
MTLKLDTERTPKEAVSLALGNKVVNQGSYFHQSGVSPSDRWPTFRVLGQYGCCSRNRATSWESPTAFMRPHRPMERSWCCDRRSTATITWCYDRGSIVSVRSSHPLLPCVALIRKHPDHRRRSTSNRIPRSGRADPQDTASGSCAPAHSSGARAESPTPCQPSEWRDPVVEHLG